MTRFLAPQMIAKEGRSAIINQTSYYSESPIKTLPIFSAGKAMQAHNSRIFSLEVEDQIDVLTVKGMPVKSSRNPNGVEAEELVEGVFNDLAQQRVSYGHWKHSLYRQFIMLK